MILAQLDPQDTQQMWWLTLGAGLLVAAVVTMLLHLLLVSVIKVERNVKKLWQTATTLARNTATTWMIEQTADAVEEIHAEASGRRRSSPISGRVP